MTMIENSYKMSNMIVSIHQPSYWPWLGHIHKINRSDVHIILDHVDVKRQSYQYRNQFYLDGKPKLLTLPISKNSRTPFIDLQFKSQDWRDKHLEILKICYKKSDFFEEIFNEIEHLYSEDQVQLPVDFIISTMTKSLELLDISTRIVRSSQLSPSGNKAELMLNLTKSVEGSCYLSGLGAKEYMQESIQDFKENKVDIAWQNFKHPVYGQNSKNEFLSGMACLDLLFFQGIEGSRELLGSLNE